MKLSELYLNYENKTIEDLFSEILKIFQKNRQAPYVDKYNNPREDEYLELVDINRADRSVIVRRRYENPVKWEIEFSQLRDAIKFTLRNGRIMRSGDYNKMTGTSNIIGTPLHILIALVSEEEYKKYSLIGKFLNHKKFGDVEIKQITFKDENAIIKSNVGEKIIKMDFWEIEEENFNNSLIGE